MSDIAKKLSGLAKEAVDMYTMSDAPLDEGIAKIASREDLNSDEIKRLVEASNTLTWLSTVKPQMDKTAEFAVASYPGVMEKIAGPIQTSTAYDADGASYEIVEDSLSKCAEEVIQVNNTDTLEEVRYGALTSLEKVASRSHASNNLSKKASREDSYLARSEFDLKCLMEETKEELAQTIEKIANRCSSVYSAPFVEFEKRAYAIFGDVSIKPLVDLVYKECTFNKEANDRVSEPKDYAFGQRHIYNETPEVSLLKEAHEYLKGMLTLRRALTEKTAEHQNLKSKYAKLLKGA